MNQKKQQIIIISTFILIIFFVFSIIFSLQNKDTSSVRTVPLIPDTSTSSKRENIQTPDPVKQPSHINVESLINPSQEAQSTSEIAKITTLPIYIKDIKTTKGDATINIYTLPNEPTSILHFEIYGPNYNVSEASLDNPNAIIFSEAFLEAKKLFTIIGVDPKKIILIYGTRQYIHDTSKNWVNAFGLLN